MSLNPLREPQYREKLLGDLASLGGSLDTKLQFLTDKELIMNQPTVSLNVDLTVNDLNTFVSTTVVANIANSKELQIGFVVPKTLFRGSLLETLFTFEGDKFGFYVTVLGLFVNFSNLSKIAKDEVLQRRLVA